MVPSTITGIDTKVKEYLYQHPDATLKEIGDFVGVSRQWVHILLQRMNLKTQSLSRKSVLTTHQLDILRYVARGYTDKRIAEAMGCNAQSIRNTLQAVYKKLDVHKRHLAVQRAIKQGIMPTDPPKRPKG